MMYVSANEKAVSLNLQRYTAAAAPARRALAAAHAALARAAPAVAGWPPVAHLAGGVAVANHITVFD
jgi:hypothetical protein